MIDFYVVNINPITKSVVEKLQFKSKKISIHPEDTFHDIKNKIWILHGIPPYRQFLFSPPGFTLQDVYVNDIIVPCDINDWCHCRHQAHYKSRAGIGIQRVG